MQPTLVFLDEATSALDEASEAHLYGLLRAASWCPTIVSVGHRSTIRDFHDHVVELDAFVDNLPERNVGLSPYESLGEVGKIDVSKASRFA